MADEYDTIIVGAGSAGCVLANLLSAAPDHRVLLLEAGGWDSNPMIATPMLAGEITRKNLYNWDDVSEPDPELCGRRSIIPHGKVIGGSSSINYMAFTRGHPFDYARWVRDGAKGWSYDDLLPFFRQIEKWQGGADAWRGGRGPVGAVQPVLRDPIGQAWLDAAQRQGIATSKDLNGEVPEGISPIQYSSWKGRRCSSGRVFLRPAKRRSNLTVEVNCHATRVLFDRTRAVGIEYRQGDANRRAYASQRVVLCAGAINTPHLLMLSGVGPADHLRAHGITPRLDLPVGRNLEDHLGFGVFWRRQGMGDFYRELRLDRVMFNIARAQLTGSGPAAALPAAFMGYVRSAPDLPQPDLELLLQIPSPEAGFWLSGRKHAAKDVIGTKVYLTGQESRGEITLRSADPTDRPIIRYNSLSAPQDLARLRTGYRIVRDMVADPAFDRFRGVPLLPEKVLEEDGEIDAFIKATATQQYHPASTCRMGAGPDAVLDEQLRVRGAEGLHVVDASAMPNLVSGNPNIVIMTMAARAASLWTEGK